MSQVCMDIEFHYSKGVRNFEIISIGFVVLDKTGKIVDQFYSLVKPSCNVDKDILDLTGLSMNELMLAPTWKEVYLKVMKYRKRYNNYKWWVFGTCDSVVLKHACYKLGVENSFKGVKDFQKFLVKTWKGAYQNYFPMKEPSLKVLKQLYGLDDIEVSHNALDDAKDLAYVVMALKRRKQWDVECYYALIENKIISQLKQFKFDLDTLKRQMKFGDRYSFGYKNRKGEFKGVVSKEDGKWVTRVQCRNWNQVISKNDLVIIFEYANYNPERFLSIVEEVCLN